VDHHSYLYEKYTCERCGEENLDYNSMHYHCEVYKVCYKDVQQEKDIEEEKRKDKEIRIILTINTEEVSTDVMQTGGIVQNLNVLLNEVDDNFGNVKIELI